MRKSNTCCLVMRAQAQFFLATRIDYNCEINRLDSIISIETLDLPIVGLIDERFSWGH